MSAPWQELAAYAAVALAGLWLALRWHRRRSTAKACDGCHAVAPAPRGRLHLPVIVAGDGSRPSNGRRGAAPEVGA